jgi:hypothetical protein
MATASPPVMITRYSGRMIRWLARRTLADDQAGT